MKKPKFKLQPFEIKDGTQLSSEFLSKIMGGQLGNSDPSSGGHNSNAPDYTISATTSIESETKDEG
ncbi:MAG: hypothetical protein ABI172_13380 [Ginsengibacter sp.]